MTSVTVAPIDQDVRQRLETEMDATFFVEAGAGTGKTRELVERLAALVASGVPVERVAAITFTDAAAAELRDRVRVRLEEGSNDAKLSVEERARCARGALDIDLASLQTIHSFAGSLLRLFPLEAGLPPSFTMWNELERDIAFKERFRTWLYDEVPANPACRRTVQVALALGLRADQLAQIAARLQEYHDLLDDRASWHGGGLPDALDVAHQTGRELLALPALLHLARDPDDDPLAANIRLAQPIAWRLSETATSEEALGTLKRYRDLKTNGSRGRQADWDKDATGNPVPRIKETFKSVNELADGTLRAHRAEVLGELLANLRDFTLAFARERREMGVATFHDLLVWARDLLRDNSDVRRRAHARYERILVDEFQDTDPLQVEIAWFLAADPLQAEVKDWRKLIPQPGRLFVVGDPKQSIYRFRRADIGMYEDVRQAMGAGSQVMALTQSFRSVEPLLKWVNYHLGSEMNHQPGVQPPYRDLQHRHEPDDPGSEPSRRGAYRIGSVVEGKAGERWLAEARAVASLAQQIVDEGWLVTHSNQPQPHPARYQDICVLLPTRSNLRRLERAFEGREVPYRMESGSLVLNTAEVRDLLSCLRALEDPSDQVALVAALRSPAYACSDVDLLAWAEAGGRFDYEHPLSASQDGVAPSVEARLAPGVARVQAALDSLLDFHRRRHSRSSASTIEAFIRERMLAVQAFGHPRPREAWRRLRYVVAQARRLASSGQPTLRAALDWLEGLQSESFYDAESAVPEGDDDAVRFMTVHGSKGLEFPIVILTGLGAMPSYRGGPRIAADRRAGRVELYLSANFETAGYDAEREDQMDRAERIRLLYVATTRARDHLVLSLFHTKRELESHAGRIVRGLHDVPELCHAVVVKQESAPPVESAALVPGPVSPDSQRISEVEWITGRDTLINTYGRERRFTATSLAHERVPDTSEESESPLDSDDAVPVDDEAPRATKPVSWLRPGRGATALGIAVHAVLQTIDLRSLSQLEELARAASTRYGIPGREAEIAGLVRAAASSATVVAATSSSRYWREVPVGVSHEGTMLEGSIDLLYEHPDATLGVVDYKTDRVSSSELQHRLKSYEIQGAAYAFAVEQVLGKRVSSVEFVFASLNQTVSLERDQVERLLSDVGARLSQASAKPS